MGYVECSIMEPKRVSASPVSGCSISSLRGQTSLKSTTFCPGSSSRTTRAIIQDHMVSHYKKVFSAKAVVDASVPKSLMCSVKYNDQIKREQLRKGDRPHSAHSLSQRNSRASCLSSQRWRSVQGEDYFCPGRSMVSTPKFTTSFHAKQIVYPPFTVGGFQGLPHNVRPSSDFDYRSPQPTSHRQPSAHSSAPPGTQSSFKSFQDPVQKTYSGDLLQKHSHYFTQEDKPFTPRTLKSDKSSYLAQYRYYTSPRNKQNQGRTNSALLRQETYHGSTQTREYSTEFDDPPQGFSTEYDWSEDESNGLNVSVSRQQNKNVKSRSSSLFHSSTRFSPDGIKSPIMMRVSAEEEELMYLEFIADVTNDILTRGLFSDRVLERVFQRHINMNKHRLDEGKMRHRLEVLRKDFNTPTCSADVKTMENNLYEQPLSLERRVSSSMETKENNNLLPYASLVKDHVSPGGAVPLYVSTQLYACSAERTVLATEAGKEDFEGLCEKNGTESPSLVERVSERAVVNEEDLHSHHGYNTLTSQEYKHQHNDYTTVTGDESLHLITSEDNRDVLSDDLEDLGRSLSESLRVSGNTFNNDQEAAIEQHMNTNVSLSDDEF